MKYTTNEESIMMPSKHYYVDHDLLYRCSLMTEGLPK